MNREIKFRAWVKPGKMQYDVVPFQWDYCIDRMFHKCIESNGAGILGSGGSEAKFELYGKSYQGEADKCLMQYTGLKDKNGKEIYEGDIMGRSLPRVVEYHQEVCTQYGHGDSSTTIYIGFSFGYYGNTSGDVLREMEVIGNIYETPELIKK